MGHSSTALGLAVVPRSSSMICILGQARGLASIKKSPAIAVGLYSTYHQARDRGVRMEGQKRERRGREPDEESDDIRGPRLPGTKRTVAMHVGYIGTAFKGLQAARELPVDDTIECVLERALAESVFMDPANVGDLFKIKWSRNSRTDKGVHSLSTVIGFRILLQEGDQVFESDKEGLDIAAKINQHLPSTVRVFSVQRTQKSFNSRRACLDRTYEYYLPLNVILDREASKGFEVQGDGSVVLSEEETKRLDRFTAALKSFEGNHCFRNYCGDSRSYARERKRRADPEGLGFRESGTQEGTAASIEPGQPAGEKSDGGGKRQKPASLDEEGEGEGEEEGEGGTEEPEDAGPSSAVNEGGSNQPWIQDCHWVGELPKGHMDRVVAQHYRIVSHWKVGEPRALVEGGVICLKLEVRGMSFMLNQIRNMIGAACAVGSGVMSEELVGASLSSLAKISVPRSPPHTLLLSDCSFGPFRKQGDEGSAVIRCTGESLALREGGRRNRDAFRVACFDRALNDSLLHPDWGKFKQGLKRHVWPLEGQEEVVRRAREWEEDKERRRREREEKERLQEGEVAPKDPSC